MLNKLIGALDQAERDNPAAVIVMVISLVFLFVVAVIALTVTFSLLAEVSDWLLVIPLGIMSLMAVRYLHNRIKEYS